LFAQSKYYEKILPLWADVQDIQSILALPDSSFLLVGNYTYVEPVKWFAHTTKITKHTDIVWQTLFNNAGESLLFDIIQGNFGHYATTGTLAEDYIGNSINAMCSYFINNVGLLQNLSNYGVVTSDSRAYSITRTSDGGYLSVGYLVNGGYSHYTLYAVKLGTDGSKQWEKIYPIFDSHCTFREVITAPDGGYYLTGSVNMNWNDFPLDQGNILLMKIDSIGNIEWSKVHNVGSMDQGLRFQQTTDGGFIIGGLSALSNSQIFHPYILKTDSIGSFIWGKQYFTTGGRGEATGVRQLNDGGYIICGSYGAVNTTGTSIQTQIEMYLLRTDATGTPLWYRIYGNPINNFGGYAHDYAYDFTPTLDGGYMIVGRKDSMLSASEGYAYAWLVKTNCMGLLTVPQASFTLVPPASGSNAYTLINQSQYAYPDSIDGGHYIVNWGDGSAPFLCGQGFAPCIQDTLLHTYQAPGIYPVTLQAIVCNDTSTYTRAVCLGVEPNPQAQFTYNDFGGAVQFTNLSQNAYFAQGGYCVWDFGDGSPTTTQINPTHTFTENGNYPVTLTVVVCQDTSVYMQFVQVQTVGVSPPFFEGGQVGEQVVVYPNPAQNTLHFTLQNSLTPPAGWSVSLFTPAGQRVLHSVVSPVGTPTTAGVGTPATASVEIGHLPVGIYFYTVQSGGVVLARGKVAVVR